jgi:hypothetical protein
LFAEQRHLKIINRVQITQRRARKKYREREKERERERGDDAPGRVNFVADYFFTTNGVRECGKRNGQRVARYYEIYV